MTRPVVRSGGDLDFIPSDMVAPKSSRNFFALFLLIFGKALGIVGLMVGSRHHTLGAVLLVLDGVCIAAAIAVALQVGRAQAKETEEDKERLARMIREGTLGQYLRDLDDEAKSAKEREPR